MSNSDVNAPISSPGGSTSLGSFEAGAIEAVKDLVEQVKELAAASNDSAILSSMIEELKAMCEKISDASDSSAESDAEQLACLKEIKDKNESLIHLGNYCY